MHSFVRSVKYFVHLCVLCAAVILVMHLADMLAVAPAELPALLFASWRGWVARCGRRPPLGSLSLYGFITRRVEGFLDDDRERVVNAFRAEGFVPADDDGEGDLSGGQSAAEAVAALQRRGARRPVRPVDRTEPVSGAR